VKKLTEMQQKIINDVRSQISTSCVVPTFGTYGFYVAKDGGRAGKAEEAEFCRACALGSMMMSLTNVTGKTKPEPMTAPERRHRLWFRSDIVRELSAYFNEETLNLMESAFESSGESGYSDRLGNRVTAHFYKYQSPGERLLAILDHLEANGGEFSMDALPPVNVQQLSEDED
jgi:hypothetical protein